MLWSPNEVLAYVKDEKHGDIAEKKQADRLVPTASYGGFLTWPNPKEDFILIAENSEIHGPNPLFTIPKLDASVDLNLLSTQILSADYQGLSNNKLLPGKNAQLLMPDIAPDTHVATVYFFLFDSEARGFVRPVCLAYFTADKYKLVKLVGPILKRLTEVCTIMQHFNISCTIDDLKSFKESVISSSEAQSTKSEDIVNEYLLQNIQEVLDIVENYKGSDIYDQSILWLLDILEKKILSEELQNWISSPSIQSTEDTNRSKLSCRPNTKTVMKDLHHICDKGIVLALYHLFITHQFFRRKYENIVTSQATNKEKCLHFGACLKNSAKKQDKFDQNKCISKIPNVPSSFSLQDADYFICLSSSFEKTLLNFISWGKESENQVFNNSSELSFCDYTSSAESVNSASSSSGYLSYLDFDKEKYYQESCGHIVSLKGIWDIIECFNLRNPGLEGTFLRILKLFDNSQGLVFSLLTRSPIIVISSPPQLLEAKNFITALSILTPRRKKESILVDLNRMDPLTEEDFNTLSAVNICLNKQDAVESIIPIELMPRMCILNLRDFSLTTPTYSGRLLSNVDQRLRIIPQDGPVFSVLVGLLAEIEFAINWWAALTASSAESSQVSSHVLSKGYTRSDMQIMEKLFRLREEE